jgi:hypothetical protein
MTTSAYEIVLYAIDDVAQADRARAGVRDHLRDFAGFRRYTPLINARDPSKRADIVEWASLADAEAAAEAVPNHPELAPFMKTIASVDRIGHFLPQSAAAGSPFAGGVEVAFFRLKPGVTETQAHTAHQKAVRDILSAQPGWIAEYFVRFDDCLYLDLLLAESRERAEALCRLWYDHPDCLAFANLVEVVDMKFGGVI